MPTKPSTSPPPFGQGDGSGNYTAGDRVGDPSALAIPDTTNGYTPGVEIEPESFNFYVGGSILDWQTNWVAQGTSDADLSAHIAETDSTGLMAIASANFGGTSYTNTALGAAVVITNNTGAGTGSRSLLVVADDGVGIEVVNSSATQPALYVVSDFSGGSGLSMRVQCLDGGKVAEFQAVNDPADGIDIDALGTGKYGAQIRAAEDGAPILVLDRLSGAGQVRGSISFPERTRASAPLNGDVWKTRGLAGSNRGFIEWEDDGGAAGLLKGTQRAWSTEGGLGYSQEESIGPTATTLGTFVNEVTLVMDFTVPKATEPFGDYIVEWSALVTNSGGSNPGMVLRITGPGAFSQQIEIDFTTIGDQQAFSFRKRFAYSGGPDAWTLDFHSSIAGQSVAIAEASIVARGAYE